MVDMKLSKNTTHKLTEKYRKKLQNDKGIFKNFPIEEYFMQPYPVDSQVIKEKKYLQSLPTQQNLKYITSADKQLEYFKSELQKIGIQEDLRNNKKMKSLMSNIAPLIVELKYYYKRPRPNEIGVDGMIYLESAQTPAYPSGHSLQSKFMALYLADKYPNKRNEILEIGEKIGLSRIMARVHYPSDHIFGKQLGTHLYVFYKNNTPPRLH
jgi:hypothetical protein